jgi:catechol 2,3-dioxygenase-like lactoylglutathione lyase family enzyme
MTTFGGLSINKLQHVGIPVTDIRVSEKFYSQLGFSKVMEAEFDHAEGKGLCIMMQQRDAMIELYQMPGEARNEIKRRKDGHVDHIAFDVSDIQQAYDVLKTNGFKIIEDSPVFLKFWTKGCKYFNIIGPDGERVEFNQILI